MALYQNSDNTTSNLLSFYKSRGTYASPTVITSGDYLGEIVGWGYDGSNYRRSGSIRFKSAGTIAGTRVPSEMEFYTSTNSNPSVETLRGTITNAGTFSWQGQMISYGGSRNIRAGIATTSTFGISSENTTEATSIVPVQMSPRIQFSARVWNTTGAGSAETSDWIIENLPTSGTTPSSLLKFGYSANGGSYGYPYTFSNLGAFTATLFNGLTITANATNTLNIATGKTLRADYDTTFNGAAGTVTFNGSGNQLSFPTGVNTIVGTAGTNTITGLKTFQKNAIAATSTDGSLIITNDTPSTSGVPVQMSPRMRLRANVWNTTATAANNTFDWIGELFPTSANTPTAVYRLGFSRAGGSYVYPYLFGDTGNISFPLTAGVKLGISNTEKIGLWGVTPVVQQATNAYTSDPESSAYSGIDNLQVGSVYAQLSDLNILRVAYDTLRASYDDLLAKLKNTGIIS